MTDSAAQGPVIPLKRVWFDRPRLELDPAGELRIHARRFFAKPWAVRREDVFAAVDARELVWDEPAVVLTREPDIAWLHTGSNLSDPTLTLLFRQPQRAGRLRQWYFLQGPPQSILTWRKTRSKQGQWVHGVELAPKDSDAALAALHDWGVRVETDLGRTLVELVGVIEDPAEAAAVQAEREKKWRKTLAAARRWTVVLFLGLYARPMLNEDSDIGTVEFLVRLAAVFGLGALIVGLLRDRAAARPWGRVLLEMAVGAAALAGLATAASGLAGLIAWSLFWAWVGAAAYLISDEFAGPG